MMNSMTMRVLLALALCLGLATASVAQEALWDQTDGYESWSMGFFNCVAGGPPMGSTTYTCNDVVVPAEGWAITDITVIFDGFDPGWEGAVTEAVLFIEPKTGSTPMGDPGMDGTTVAATATVLPNYFLAVTATGLETILGEGEYWVGLTPIAPNAANIHVSVAAIGDDSPSYDAFGFPMPMWMAWVQGMDGAMLIEGNLGTVSSEAVALDEIKAIYR